MQLIDNKKFISNYIRDNCLFKPRELMFGKLPGTRYSSQFYLSPLLYDTQLMTIVGEEFYKIVKTEIGHFNFQLAGREWSSIPLLTSLPMYLKLEHDISVNSFLIRKTRKNYGKNNYIEGNKNSLPVLIVDDLCNSQNGIKFCYDVVTKTENMEVLPYIFAVLNKYRKSTVENAHTYDRYLGDKCKTLFIVSGDDIDEAMNESR